MFLLFQLGDEPAIVTKTPQSTIPRWLIKIESREREYTFATIGGDIDGIFYEEYLVAVSAGGVELDIENMALSNASASVELLPRIYEQFNARKYLRRTKCMISIYTEECKIIDVVYGSPTNIQIDQVTGVISFDIEETFKRDPDFPPT